MITSDLMPSLLFSSVALAGGLGMFAWIVKKAKAWATLEEGDIPILLIVFAVALVFSLAAAIEIAALLQTAAKPSDSALTL